MKTDFPVCIEKKSPKSPKVDRTRKVRRYDSHFAREACRLARVDLKLISEFEDQYSLKLMRRNA